MTTETNAERLENMSPIGVDNDGNLLVKHDDWFWLQEQAERVQEREASNARISKISLNRQKYIDELVDEIARLREALNFYASEDKWKPTITYTPEGDKHEGAPLFIEDSGEIARQALGESHGRT